MVQNKQVFTFREIGKYMNITEEWVKIQLDSNYTPPMLRLVLEDWVRLNAENKEFKAQIAKRKDDWK